MRNCLTALTVCALCAPSFGSVIVNDWTFDFSAVPNEGVTSVITGVDEITFNGRAHVLVDDTNGNLAPDAGELFTVNGLLSANALVSDGSFTNLAPGIGSTFFLDFVFTVDNVFTASGPGLLGFDHLPAGTGPSDGILSVYLDGIANGQSPFDPSVGAPSLDGPDATLIAEFAVVDGGGFVSPLPPIGDGTDNATFVLLNALPGVLLSSSGEDLGLLAAGGTEVLLALADSNLDVAPFDDPLDTADDGLLSAPGFAGVGGIAPVDSGFGYDITGIPTNFFALENGSVRLRTEVIPEPVALTVWGAMSAFAFASVRRRRS